MSSPQQPVSIYSFFMDSESTARPIVLSPLSTYLANQKRERSTGGAKHMRRAKFTSVKSIQREDDEAEQGRHHAIVVCTLLIGNMHQRPTRAQGSVLKIRADTKPSARIDRQKPGDTMTTDANNEGRETSLQQYNMARTAVLQGSVKLYAPLSRRGLHLRCNIPESQITAVSHMVVPVMTRDRSDVRNSAAFPTSSLYRSYNMVPK